MVLNISLHFLQDITLFIQSSVCNTHHDHSCSLLILLAILLLLESAFLQQRQQVVSLNL